MSDATEEKISKPREAINAAVAVLGLAVVKVGSNPSPADALAIAQAALAIAQADAAVVATDALVANLGFIGKTPAEPAGRPFGGG